MENSDSDASEYFDACEIAPENEEAACQPNLAANPSWDSEFPTDSAHLLPRACVPESPLGKADVGPANLSQIDTSTSRDSAETSRPEADGEEKSFDETSEPGTDSGADDGENEDGESDNELPYNLYYCQESETEESFVPVSQSTQEGDTKESAIIATSLHDQLDWSGVQLMLNSRTAVMTLADIKDALVKAVEANNAPAIGQLLPLMPESHVCVRGRSSIGHVQESLGNMFLPNCLSSAIKSGNLEAARALIRGPESPAGCKQLGETDLILAVQPGSDIRVVKEFLGTSCVNAQDLHGRTAVSYAAQYGLAKIVRFLVKEAGANPQIVDSQGWTPLRYAIAALEDDQTEEQSRVACGDIIDYLMTN